MLLNSCSLSQQEILERLMGCGNRQHIYRLFEKNSTFPLLFAFFATQEALDREKKIICLKLILTS